MYRYINQVIGKKANSYALQGDVDRSIENLQKAIDLNPQWREMAKTDSDFDRIRDDPRFPLKQR